jgi:putative ABC transport system permease protein
VFLALREMRRAATRFGLLVLAVGLLVFLILVQQALQTGLITAFVGGIRNQSAPVLVFTVDAQRTLQGSVIPPPLEESIRATDGVGAAARLGQGTFTVRVGDADDADDADAAIVGTDDATLGMPEELRGGRLPAAPGEAVGSDADFEVGETVAVVGADANQPPVTLTVVGVARDVEISVTATLFTDFATYESAVRAANPDAAAVLPSVIAVRPAPGVSADELTARINAVAPQADALTREDAANESPGVAEVRQSFQIIFLLYGLVVPLVTGLFFLIITLQKSGSLVLLRAMGCRAGLLVRALLLQVVIVIALGLLFGVALYAPTTRLELGSLSLRFDATAVVVWAVLLLVLGVLSAIGAVRKVLSIEPIEATMGSGVR